MLQSIDKNLWHTVHAFTANALPVTTRMTVVRLPSGKLLIHSPTPLTDALQRELDELGQVAFIIAPNLMHHLFLAPFAAAFPNARIYGPAALRNKRPDLGPMMVLPANNVAEWMPDLEHFVFEGIPAGCESVFFHRPTATLIVTDLVQWMQGDIAWSTKIYAALTGVRKQLAVPLTVRLLTRDRDAAAKSAKRLLDWPFERIIFAHNSIIDTDAHALVSQAFKCFTCPR